MLTLDRFKLYAHIDHADEDELIESLIRAADTAVRERDTGAVYRADLTQSYRHVQPIPGKGGRKWR